MQKQFLTSAASLVLLAVVSTGAEAGGVSGAATGSSLQNSKSIVTQAHSFQSARYKLGRLGYYSIQTERSTPPYSFVACKRGQRYHIHVDYFGDLTQVDGAGNCRDYDSEYRDDRPRYGYGNRQNRYRGYDN